MVASVRNKDQFIFDGAASSAAVPVPVPIASGKFTVKVWATTSWDGNAVELRILNKDGGTVLVKEFTETDDTFAYYGESATEEVLTGAITGAGVASDLNMTVAQDAA